MKKVLKSENAFKTISEVSDILEIPHHILRFWEAKFPQLSPLKMGGGRRYYRPDDIKLINRIKELIYTDGLTIKGVKKLIRDKGIKAVVDKSNSELILDIKNDKNFNILSELKDIRSILDTFADTIGGFADPAYLN